MLVSANLSGEVENLPDVVRVEPSNKSTETETHPEATANSQEEIAQEETTAKAPNVGHNVAYKVLGSSIFRGVITEVRNWWFTRFLAYLSLLTTYLQTCLFLSARMIRLRNTSRSLLTALKLK